MYVVGLGSESSGKSAADSLLPIVQSQRERYRLRAQELEAVSYRSFPLPPSLSPFPSGMQLPERDGLSTLRVHSDQIQLQALDASSVCN